ncbi:MAG: hypothetical protein ACRDSF_22480 [Pseudonocardiaceae bacterium]
MADTLVREYGTAATSLKPSYYNHYTDTANPERYVIFNKVLGQHRGGRYAGRVGSARWRHGRATGR